MYVRRLANPLNAVSHGGMDRSPWYTHIASYIAATCTSQRSEAEATLQVQGVIQTSLSSHPPVRAFEGVSGGGVKWLQ